MPLPIGSALSTNLISDEIGYTMSYPHFVAGPLKSDNSPGTFSLTYFFRPGNVSSVGVTQTAPFGMSAFYGQEAIYRCVTFTSSSTIVGTATVVSYYKNLQTITFSLVPKSFCVRQNWDGNMAISNVLNGTYSLGSTCSAVTGQSVGSSSSVYTSYGVKVFNIGGYDIRGNTQAGSPAPMGTLAFSASTSNIGGTFSNLWWANPNVNNVDGRLNKAGIWNAANVPISGVVADQYVGTGYLSFSINATESRSYYVGIGSDNYMTIKLDGATCLSQTGSNPTSNDYNFKFWNVYPITFSTGLRRLEVINNNEDNQGSMGVDIYDNSLASLQSIFNNAIPNSSATPSGLNLMYTSSIFKSSGTFFQNLAISCPINPTTTTTSTTTTTTTVLTYNINWSYNFNSSTAYIIIKVNGTTVVNQTDTLHNNDVGSGNLTLNPGDTVYVESNATSGNALIYAEVDLNIVDNGTTLTNTTNSALNTYTEAYGPYTPTGDGTIIVASNIF